jgi:hypothetical protein
LTLAQKKLAKTPVLRKGRHSAYKVLNFVIDAIEEEPRRLYMPDWVTLFKGTAVGMDASRLKRKPECGTAACVAGWINIVTRQDVILGSSSAMSALGLGDMDSEMRNDLYNIFISTRATNDQIVKRLRAFIEEHEDTLKQRFAVVE